MAHTEVSVLRDFWETLKLSLPLGAAYAGHQLMSLVDTAIVGRLGAVPLAATGMGSSLFFIASILGIGTLLGLDPLVSQAIGAQEPAKARRHFKEAVVLSWLLVIPMTLLTFVSMVLMPLLSIDLPTQEETLWYLLGRTPCLLPLFIYIAARGYLQALSRTRPVLLSTVLANLVNIPATLFLALGDQGLVAMGMQPIGFVGWGVFGAGLASTLVTFVQMFVLLWVIKRIELPSPPSPATREGLVSLMRLGWPIALQHLAEGGIFVMVTLLVGRFGPLILSGHQIALRIASFTFSLCLGISSATSVRVGHAIGRKDPAGSRRAGFIGLATGGAAMALSAIFLLLWSRPIASLFTSDADVIQAALPFLAIAALFQIWDGLQIVASGALRGASDTRYPMLTYITAHWLIGFPIAYVLTFWLKMGPLTLWWGLTIGLFVASIILARRFHHITRRPLAALQAE